MVGMAAFTLRRGCESRCITTYLPIFCTGYSGKAPTTWGSPSLATSLRKKSTRDFGHTMVLLRSATRLCPSVESMGRSRLCKSSEACTNRGHPVLRSCQELYSNHLSLSLDVSTD